MVNLFDLRDTVAETLLCRPRGVDNQLSWSRGRQQSICREMSSLFIGRRCMKC